MELETFIPVESILIAKDVTEILPHRSPFVFVDDISSFNMEKLVTYKTLKSSDFQFYNANSENTDNYPRVLLFEHGFQTMFLQGYYLGIAKRVWNSGYKPVGLATHIKYFHFSDFNLSPGDRIKTESKLVRHIKNYFLIVEVKIFKNENELIANGEICGIFLKDALEVTPEKENFAIKKENPRNNRDHSHFLFYNQKNKKYFDSTYWFLEGHFPHFPCIPGCLFVQGMLQSLDPAYVISSVKEIKFESVALPYNEYVYDYRVEQENVCCFRVLDFQTQNVVVTGSLSFA